MPISKDQVTFFDRELKVESLSDVFHVYDQNWIEKLRESLDKNDRVATSALQQSMRSQHEISPTFAAFRITGNSYWRTVDQGRKPGKMPPMLAMMEHIRNRNNRLKPLLNKIQYFQSLKPSAKPRKNPIPIERAVRSLAFVFGMGIKKHGIKPTNFVSEAITKQDINDMKKDIAKQLKNGLLGK